MPLDDPFLSPHFQSACVEADSQAAKRFDHLCFDTMAED
jgi:hypothetical protein